MYKDDKVRLQVWVDPALLADLDVVREQAGRLSRTEVIVMGWPAMLRAVRQQTHLPEPEGS